MAKEEKGRWTELFGLSNVAVHATLLPTGKVLYWGRRSNPKGTLIADMPKSLDEPSTKAFLWDPLTRMSEPTANEPFGIIGEEVNLFCSGHCILPNGKVLVVGGHIQDTIGRNQACTYDPATNKFTATTPMNKGR